MSASLAEVERAIAAQPEELTWDWASDKLLPVMPRVRPYPAGFPEPLQIVVEPGVTVGFAVDVGPAFMSVHGDLLRSWGVSIAEVHARSLANVIGRARAVDPASITGGDLDGTPTRWLQTGESIGSVLVLVPDDVRRIFGPAPAFFITPMRDLIIGLPMDVSRDLATWLWLEVASLDPNCLGPIGYRFDGRTIVPEPLDSNALSSGLADAPQRRAYVA